MKRPFVPAFLKNLDKKLLLNKPNTWSVRTHLVVYYSILFMLILGLLSFLSGVDPRAYSDVSQWTGFTGLSCFIGIVVWLIYLLRFNVFKRFGLQKTGEGWRTFALIFVSVFFIVLPAYVPTLIESWRANMAYSSDEIMNDINSINKKISQVNYNMLQKEWETDTLELVPENSMKEERLDNSTIWDSVKNQQVKANRIFVTDSLLKNRLAVADSVVKISNTLFIQKNCPNYALLYDHDVDEHSKIKYQTSRDIYYSVVKNFVPVNKAGVQKELNVLLKKYHYEGARFSSYPEMTYDISPDNEVDKSPDQELRQFYNLSSVDDSIRNITDKKYRWDADNFGIYFRIIFYITFCMSLLVFIFRHTTAKTFFLTLLTCVVVMILTGILISFGSYYRGGEQMFFGFLLFYYVLFFVLMIVIFGATTRKLFNGIALNLVTFFTAFVPLFGVGYYYAMLHHEYEYMDHDYAAVFKNEHTHYVIAEIAGVLLFIILLEPLFKRLYRKWYSLPEN